MTYEEIEKLALSSGIIDAKLIRTSDVVIREWVVWKCRFGCPDYGLWLTCPPYAPKPEETRQLLKEYTKALLLKVSGDRTKLYDRINKLERELFLQGYYKVFSFGGGHCPYCKKCTLSSKRCKYPILAKPSMEACGIDVLTTVQKLKYPLKIFHDKEQIPEWFGLILLE